MTAKRVVSGWAFAAARASRLGNPGRGDPLRRG
jgi:hypothetical protein